MTLKTQMLLLFVILFFIVLNVNESRTETLKKVVKTFKKDIVAVASDTEEHDPWNMPSLDQRYHNLLHMNKYFDHMVKCVTMVLHNLIFEDIIGFEQLLAYTWLRYYGPKVIQINSIAFEDSVKEFFSNFDIFRPRMEDLYALSLAYKTKTLR